MKPGPFRCLSSLVALFLIFFPTVSLQAGAGEQAVTGNNNIQQKIAGLEQRIELDRHRLLIELKSRPDVSLSDFSTDGCSGGLSAGWQILARAVPQFASDYGTHPPWESCCTTHDRAYHLGGQNATTPMQSFNERWEADLALQACVLESGKINSPLESKKFNVPEHELLRLYTIAAELMYQAVRIGGMPCTGLPWRWGYGWPECR